MTVAELIKVLKEYPQDSKVFYAKEYYPNKIGTVYRKKPHIKFDKDNDSVVLGE